MSTQKSSKVRHTLVKIVALLSIGLPVASLLPGTAAMAQSASQQNGSRHHHNLTVNDPMMTAPAKMRPSTYIESYNFNYQYAQKPIVNGGPTPESYLGTGFARVGTYKPGQTINIVDSFGRAAGTYTIGNVNDQIPYDAQKLNTVTVTEYDYDLASAPLVTRLIKGTGLTPSGGGNGLGSESGILIGRGVGGNDANFNNQQLAIVPSHF